MPEKTSPEVARVLITCDDSLLGAAALDAATALARKLDAELAGLFVENVNLLRMAALPFAREYALASATKRTIEAAEMERALRRQADAAREALSRAALDFKLPWSFQVVRGALLDSVLEVMRVPDVAVFGHAGQFAVSPDVRIATPVPRVVALRRPILTVYDDTPSADRALIAAGLLAKVHQTSLVVLLAAADASAVLKLRSRAAGQLRHTQIAARFQNLPTRDVHAIKSAADGSHAAALLWHGVRTADERRTFAKLIDELKCPVVLVL